MQRRAQALILGRGRGAVIEHLADALDPSNDMAKEGLDCVEVLERTLTMGEGEELGLSVDLRLYLLLVDRVITTFETSYIHSSTRLIVARARRRTGGRARPSTRPLFRWVARTYEGRCSRFVVDPKLFRIPNCRCENLGACTLRLLMMGPLHYGLLDGA